MFRLSAITILFTALIMLSLPLSSQNNSFEKQITKKIENRAHVFNLIGLDSLFYTKNIEASSIAAQKLLDSALIAERLNKLDTFVDIRYTPEIHNFVEFYTTTNRREVEIMLGLAAYYQPVFDLEIERHNLPPAIRYFPMCLSAMNVNAVSEAGAVGVWQLLYPTARIYKMHISTYIDERKITEKSTRIAVKYLKDMYNIYHDWTLALAAYSSSPAVVNRAIGRAGGKRSFWDIYNYLPEESREFIPAYIAVLYLVEYHEKHNIKPASIDLWIASDTAMVDKKLHLAQVAGYFNMSVDTLKLLNPQFRLDIIHPQDKYNYIKLPENLKDTFVVAKNDIYAFMDTVFIKPQPKVVEAPKNAVPTSRSSRYKPPSTKGKVKLTYTVKSGDNLGYIASWYGVKVADLKYWNDIYRNRIYVGDEINVYISKSQLASKRKINSLTFDQKQKLIGKSSSKSSKSKARKLDPNYVHYKVRSGDNLWIIAKKYKGISHEDLIKINNFSKKYTLYPGQFIKIKRK